MLAHGAVFVGSPSLLFCLRGKACLPESGCYYEVSARPSRQREKGSREARYLRDPRFVFACDFALVRVPVAALSWGPLWAQDAPKDLVPAETSPAPPKAQRAHAGYPRSEDHPRKDHPHRRGFGPGQT